MAVTKKTIGEEIIRFLKKDDLLTTRREKSINSLTKLFPNYKQINELLFDELNYIADNNPDFIISITNDFINDKETITKIISIVRKDKKGELKTIIDKIELISEMYESANILKLPAYILSGKKFAYQTTSSAKNIFKHLTPFGLTKRNIEYARLLRNASSHKYTVEDKYIIIEKGDKIEINEIEDLYSKLYNIHTWWSTSLFKNLFFIPKLGILVIVAIIVNVKTNEEKWNLYLKGVKIFYNDVLKLVEEEQKIKQVEKKKLLKYRYKKLKIKIRFYLKFKIFEKFRRHKLDSFLYNNFGIICDRIVYHLEYSSNILLSISSKVTDTEVKSFLDSISTFLMNRKGKLKEISNFCRNDPGLILNELKSLKKSK